jgi:hypothetical protein
MAAKKAQFGTRLNLTQTPVEAGLRKVLAQAISLALIAGVAPGPLLAQEAVLDEITVTATKRAESVMDVPLAITAMSGEAIREFNLNDVKDLIAFTPGIAGNSKDSAKTASSTLSTFGVFVRSISVMAVIRRSVCTRTACTRAGPDPAYPVFTILNGPRCCAVPRVSCSAGIQSVAR